MQQLRTRDLDYELPPELIATHPADPRDSARMLVMSRSSDQLAHASIRDLPDLLHRGDLLVFNDTSVLPARFRARRADTGGTVDGLFLGPAGESDGGWRVMLGAGGRLRPGLLIELLNRQSESSGFAARLQESSDGEWIIRLRDDRPVAEVLDQVGLMPLPPYIRKARGRSAVADDLDRGWYQTVYADPQRRQSVAAPTAGLHFTHELLARLERAGVERACITLHVGPGTFKPIVAPTLHEHRMHDEWYQAPAPSLRAIAAARENGRRVLAIGTTSVRTLESLPHPLTPGQICGPISGMTDLMIAPPHRFNLVDGMLTNFHLPRSTLLALVAAMVGLDRLKQVYRLAVERGYRFYSYGDAMLILP